MVDTQKCFRLFDLPSVPLRNVIKCFKVIDLFDLSLCSNESKEMIKSTYRKVLDFEIRVRENYKSFSWRAEDEALPDSWAFGYYYPGAYPGNQYRNIEGHKFMFHKYAVYFARSICSRPDITMKVVLCRMREIFDCQIIDISIETDGLESPSDYLVRVTSCENLTCRGDEKISNKDLKYFLEELKVRNVLELTVPAGRDFRCENVIFNSNVVALHTPSLTPENLLSADCEIIIFKNCNFPRETYELFVSRWLEGSRYRRLEYVKVEDMEEIGELEVLKTHGRVWDPQQRGRFFILGDKFEVDCSKGIDLIRSDGTLATVLINDRNFRMFVWNERFPVLTEQHKIHKF